MYTLCLLNLKLLLANYLPFACLVSDFVMLPGTKHVSIFHALLLALLQFDEHDYLAVIKHSRVHLELLSFVEARILQIVSP